MFDQYKNQLDSEKAYNMLEKTKAEVNGDSELDVGAGMLEIEALDLIDP